MTREQTYYELLGVARGATGRDVRNAYLRLLKQHHPDLAGAGGDTSRPELVPLLNRCYAVLRDPRKRAAYDAQLARSATPANKAAPRPSSRLPAVRQQTRSNLRVTLVATGALAAAAVGVEAALTFPNVPLAGAIERIWTRNAPASDVLRPPAPSENLVRREARIATSVSTADAVARSERCFQEAHSRSSLQAAQLCVIFDEAFLYWRKTPDDAQLPLYFDEGVARLRYTDALGSLGNQTDAEVDALRNRAFRALLAEVRAASESAEAQEKSEAVPVAQESGGSQPVSSNGT